MKPIATLLAIMLVSSCGSSDVGPQPVDETVPAESVEVPSDPNEGTHRYRYVESVEHPENDCSTSAGVGKELTQDITFTDSMVTIVFIPDDLPEGAEPGRRDFDEQLDARRWREIQETSDGSTMEHTIEFTESGIVMRTLRDGAECFYSVRERIDA